MAGKKKIGKPLIAGIIIILVFLIIAGLHLTGAFNLLENQTYDMRVRFWADSSYSRPSDDIVVILLDQDSLDWANSERNWGWPWPRQAYAEIIDYMNLSGANALAFDVLFSEPSVYRNARQDEIIDNAVSTLVAAEMENSDLPGEEVQSAGRQTPGRQSGDRRAGGGSRSAFRIAIDALQSLSAREDDDVFIKATENYGHVVHTVMFSSQTGSVQTWPSNIDVPLFQLENFGDFFNRFSVIANERAQFPIRGLMEATGALGSVTGIPDSDGIIRRIKPFTAFDGRAIPGLSSALLLMSGKGNQLFYNDKTNVIEWEGISIPVDKHGNALLRYRGLLDKYHPYRAMDILLSAESAARGDDLPFGFYTTPMGTNWNMLTPDNFTGTYAFFGFYAQGLYDIFSTPISSVYAGMGCHITMLDNMLKGDFIRESRQNVNLLILFAVVILIVCLTMFSNRITLSVIGLVIIVLAIFIGAFAAYQFGGLWVPMITYIAGTLAGFVTVTVYNYATEGSQKRFIKSAFSQYLSQKVVEQLILDPSQLKLGGEKREMTAIFTDIRAF